MPKICEEISVELLLRIGKEKKKISVESLLGKGEWIYALALFKAKQF